MTLGFDPNIPLMDFDNSFHDSQADPGTFSVLVQPIEEAKNLLMVAGLNPYAIVSNVTHCLFILLHGNPHLDTMRVNLSL